MNTLIHGPVASGKTLMSNLLKRHYKRLGQECKVVEDGEVVRVSGSFPWLESARDVGALDSFLCETLHSPDKHLVVVTQASWDQIYGYRELWDYCVATRRCL